MFDTVIDEQLRSDIKEYFGCFDKQIEILGVPFINGL